MKKDNFRVVEDPECSYKRLDPMPSDPELEDFYRNDYRELIRKGGRAPEMRRLISGDEETHTEKQWLQSTLYSDIASILSQYAPGRKVLDVGCGTGDFISFLKKHDFEVMGIEPSSETPKRSKEIGVEIQQATLNQFAEDVLAAQGELFDAITLLNVLEHVPDPRQIVDLARQLLNPDGIICIRVPNDFSEIQEAAKEKLCCDSWWVAVPDHVNYFSVETLGNFLEKQGFDLVYCQTDFPMELFLLMGENYLSDPTIGKECHKRRMQFERSIPSELRMRIYQAMANVGVGRNSLAFARKNR